LNLANARSKRDSVSRTVLSYCCVIVEANSPTFCSATSGLPLLLMLVMVLAAAVGISFVVVGAATCYNAAAIANVDNHGIPTGRGIIFLLALLLLLLLLLLVWGNCVVLALAATAATGRETSGCGGGGGIGATGGGSGAGQGAGADGVVA
jgi:hypothetical protein